MNKEILTAKLLDLVEGGDSRNLAELFSRYPKFAKALAKVLDPSDKIKPTAAKEQITDYERVLNFTFPAQVREFFLLPRRRTTWTALCWRESWRLKCWQLCENIISRNWPPKLPQTGICPPRRYKAGWKRCVPIWNWCRTTLPCCMR